MMNLENHVMVSVLLFFVMGILVVPPLLCSHIGGNRKWINLYIGLLQILMVMAFLYIYLFINYMSSLTINFILFDLILIITTVFVFCAYCAKLDNKFRYKLLLLLGIFIFAILVFGDENVYTFEQSDLSGSAFVTLLLFPLVLTFFYCSDRIIGFGTPDLIYVYDVKINRNYGTKFEGKIDEGTVAIYSEMFSCTLIYDKNNSAIGKISLNRHKNELKGFFHEDNKVIIRLSGKIIDKDFGKVAGTFSGERDQSKIIFGTFNGQIDDRFTGSVNIDFDGAEIPRKLTIAVPYDTEYVHTDPKYDGKLPPNNNTTEYFWNSEKLETNKVNKIEFIIKPLDIKSVTKNELHCTGNCMKEYIPPKCPKLSELISKLISENASLIALGFLILLLITFLPMYFVPPSHIILDPPSISESLSVSDHLIKTISINNVGANLSNLKIEPDMPGSPIPIYIIHNNNNSSFEVQYIKVNNDQFNNTDHMPITLTDNKTDKTISISDETRLNGEIKLNCSIHASHDDYIIKIESISICDKWLNITDNKNITINGAGNSEADYSSSQDSRGQEVGTIDVARLILIPEAVPSDLSRDRVGLFKVKIDAKYLTPGEYRGFITIKANKSTILGESEQETVGQIPVVINVAKSESSQTVGTTQKETNINISGDN